MRDKSPQELISAYFDGELNAEERQQVERLLDDDPAARQFLQELEILEQCVQELPRQRLPSSLAEGVLKEVQRRLPDRTEGSGEIMAPLPPHPASERPPRRMLTRVCVALSVAAAVLLIFSLPSRQGDRPDTDGPVALWDTATPPETATNGTLPSLSSPQVADGEGLDFSRSESSLSKGAAETDRDLQRAEIVAKDATATPDHVYYGRPPATTLAESLSADAAGYGAVAQSSELPGEAAAESSNAFVFDFPSEAVQTRVLRQFEQVLTEQQIALEDNGSIATPADEPAEPQRAAKRLDVVREEVVKEVEEKKETEPKAADVKKLADNLSQESRDLDEQPSDRVYVVDATPEQLSNTIVGLNRLAAESQAPVRLRRLGEAGSATQQAPADFAGGGYAGRGIANPQQNGQYPTVGTSNTPASGARLSNSGSLLQRRGGMGVATPAAEPAVQPSAPLAESTKSSQQSARQRATRFQAPRANEPAPDHAELQQRMAGGTPAGENLHRQASPLNINEQSQQRAIFIFRVVPSPAASPAAGIEPSQP